MEERYAEIGVMLEQQNYEGVYDASLDAQEHAEELHEVLETIETTYSDVDFIHSIETEMLQHEDYVEEVRTELLSQVETQTIPQDVITATQDLEADLVETQNI